MKVLHVNDNLSYSGGVETYLLALCPELERHGHEVHLAFGAGDASLWHRSHHLRLLVSQQSGDDQDSHDAVLRLIENLQPDVIHVHGLQNAGAIRALCETGIAVLHGHDYRPICPASNFYYKRTKRICTRRCGPGCFLVTARHHCMTPRPGPASYFYKRSRWIMKHAADFNALIAPSAGAAERYLQAGFSPSQVQVVPYFCPLQPLPEPRVLPERPTITFIGRASYNKGWEHFIAALAVLPPEVQGLMVGSFDRAATDRAKQLAASYGCERRLLMEPWAARGEISQLYSRTTVLVFPSLWPETLGIVGIEALSQGVPVVASDIGGVPEWAIEGQTGFRVPPGNPEAIARAVTPLLEPHLNGEFGRAGIELVNKKFLPEHHLRKLLQIYVGSSGR